MLRSNTTHHGGRGFRLALVLVTAATFVLVPTSPVAAVNVNLSGGMPPFGNVTWFVVSPDDRFVVYTADQTTDNAVELYSVPVTGGTPVRLSPLLPAGASVGLFEISPDSSRVVYLLDDDADGREELYSVPIAGPASANVQLSPTPPPGGSLGRITFTADSSRVVYLGDQTTAGVQELYSVPITGPVAAGVTLNEPLVAGGDVFAHRITADGLRVVYTAEQEVDERVELYSVPIAGPATHGVKLNPALVVGGDVGLFDFASTSDSTRVVYRADQGTDGVFELYSVPVAGPATAAVKLNPTLPAGGDVEQFVLTADATRAVYLADQEVVDRRELFSVPVVGPATAAVKISAPLVPFGGVLRFDLSPDSQWAVYRANQDVVTIAELYSVPIAGPPSAVTKLNGPMDPLGDVTGGYEVTQDSARVVYAADQEVDGRTELYSVPIAGPPSAGVKLNGPLVAGGTVFGAAAADESGYAVYRADQLVDDVTELFSVPITGPASAGAKLNGTLVTGGDVQMVVPLRHGQAAVYIADQNVDGQFDLFLGGNRAPFLAAPLADVTVDEDAPDTSIPLGGVFVDPDGDALALAAASSDPSVVTAVAADTTLTLAYQPDAFGATTITVTATDPGGLAATDTFAVTVNPVDETAPTIGLVDPAQGTWHLRNSAGQVTSFFYGNPGDVPFVGDWDCDGDDTPGLFRQSDAFAYLRNSNDAGIGDIRFFFGDPADVPLAGDFDGDGCDTVSIYRPSEQRFYIINELGENEGGLGEADFSFGFGNPGDKPVVGDWDGDGIDEVGLHRESTGFFYWRTTLDTGVASGEIFFGDPGDRFVAGDWGVVDGVDTPAVYRPADTTCYFRHTLTEGIADSQLLFGESPWLPVAGDFGMG